MINKELAQKCIDVAMSTGADFCEIFYQKKYSANYETLNKSVVSANSGESEGVGIRLYCEKQSVFASTNSLDEDSLLTTARNLASNFHKEKLTVAQELKEQIIEDIHPVIRPLKSVPIQEKMDLMRHVEDVMKSVDEKITTTKVVYLDWVEDVTIYNSTGKMVSDHRERTRIDFTAVATDGDLIQDARNNPGAHQGFEFYSSFALDEMARNTSRIALRMLYAQDCPSGEMTVVLGNGFGGVIFHEACGHSLEATAVAKGHSVFCSKMGQKIASDKVTAIDDGTIVNAWGSNNIDDEGNPTRRNVLIKNGVLTSYLFDQLNTRLMDHPLTGSGRREDYHYAPTSRMSNTFIAEGEDDFDEMIASTKKGLYCAKLGGGSVNPETGEFNFNCREAYLIEDGKITVPVKGATLIGQGATVLHNIDRVGKNLSFSQGMCGSLSGSIPADVGQPAIRVQNITVGGKGGKL